MGHLISGGLEEVNHMLGNKYFKDRGEMNYSIETEWRKEGWYATMDNKY